MEMSSTFPDPLAKIRGALESSWSEKTSACYNPKIAPVSYGQCAATAIVVFEHLGGEILRSEIVRFNGTTAPHFYNRVGGQRLDFTSDQLDMPDYWSMPNYLDIPSSAAEAESHLLPGQLNAMRTAFRLAMSQQHAVQHLVGADG